MQISLALPDKEPLREEVAVTGNVRDYRSSLVKERLTVVYYNRVEESIAVPAAQLYGHPD